MDHRFIQDKPTLLMVSHCVPDALGGTDRARAWQLLRLARQTHRVLLACVLDAPVNLAQWRVLDSQTQQLVIEAGPLINHSTSHLARWFNRPPSPGKTRHTDLAQTTKRWSADYPIHAVLCTHPGLWTTMRPAMARLRICDLHVPPGRQSKQQDQAARWIAARANVLTLDFAEPHRLFANRPCETFVLPKTIDPAYFTEVRASRLTKRYASPGLAVVFHSDWSRPGSSRLLSWFTRRVWPSIKKAMPDAHLRHTRPGAEDPFTTLLDASVIVSPEPNPALACLPVMQAMAMQRTVIASEDAMAMPPLLSLVHAKHLLLCKHRRQWINHTVEALRSASMRLRLSRNASIFIEHHPTIEDTGGDLIRVLGGREYTSQPVHRAA